MQNKPYNLDDEKAVGNTNETDGQKIYVFDLENHEVIKPIRGFICPRKGETLTVFDGMSGFYYHYEVINVTHGTNTASHKLVTTLHVKHIRTDK